MRPLSLAALLLSAPLSAFDLGPTPLQPSTVVPCLADLATRVAGMTADPSAQAIVRAQGLSLLSLTWEDTARTPNSCWGPNICDATIQVLGSGAPPRNLGCMPVIRPDNFTDVTGDVGIDHLSVLVGNEHGEQLQPIPLASYLRDFASYQSSPTGRLRGTLLDARDSQVLVSAQACLLPIDAGGTTSFAPVVYSYEGQPNDPAVLVLLATPEGTSAQVLDQNAQASAGVWHGQRLYHNRHGSRAVLTARRLSDVTSETGQPMPTSGSDAATGMSEVLLIQIPLRHSTPRRFVSGANGPAACAPVAGASCLEDGKAVESAVVSSGPIDGPWLGLDACTIERDPRYPIRVTAQFYQATTSGSLRSEDAARLAAAVHRIYLHADCVGSLVVDGWKGRTTAPHPCVASDLPAPWWREPCEAYAAASGEPYAAALARIHARLGADWQPTNARELANALALVRH